MADDTTTLTDSTLSGATGGVQPGGPILPATGKDGGSYFDPNDPLATANTLATKQLAAGWTITGMSIVAGWAGCPVLVIQSGL
jgi:hypothetical protein